MVWNSIPNAVIPNGTRFIGFGTRQPIDGGETSHQQPAPYAGLGQYLGVVITSNTLDQIITAHLRVATANSTLNVVVGIGLTGTFSTSGGTAAIAVDDLINISTVVTGATGTATMRGFTMGQSIT